MRRVYDQFLSQQVRSSSGTLARLDAFAAQAERLDNLLGDTSNGLNASLQSFTDAINEVSSTPSSISARQVLLAEGNALAERLKGYDTRLREMSADVDSHLVGAAGEINVLAQGIARLNGDIATAIQQTGHPPNDMLDQRDALIDQLSSKVGVTVVSEGESTLNVFIGTGQPLVLGTTASQITTAKDPLDAERVQLALKTASGTVDISRSVSGGELGGLLDWRKQMLDPARNELGRITLAVASQVNAQHREGMDLTGALGGNFFNVGGVGVVPATTNTTSAVATATRVNLGALTANDYVVTRTGTGYTVRRQDTGASVTFTGTGTSLDPLLFDGLSVSVGAGVAAGDQFVDSSHARCHPGLRRGDHRSGAHRGGGGAAHRGRDHQHRHGHHQPGRGPDAGRHDAQPGEHRVHLRHYLLGERRRGSGLHGRRQHRRERLAPADRRQRRPRAIPSRCAPTPAPWATTAMPSRWWMP